jgi:hypothetical protein
MNVKIPVDRGYVAITPLPSGEKRVEVFDHLSANGPTQWRAAHSNVSNVLVLSKAKFEQRGQMSFSTDVVEVLFDSGRNQLIIRDPA